MKIQYVTLWPWWLTFNGHKTEHIIKYFFNISVHEKNDFHRIVHQYQVIQENTQRCEFTTNSALLPAIDLQILCKFLQRTIYIAVYTWDVLAEPAADAPPSGNFDDSLSSASASEACNLVHFSSVCRPHIQPHSAWSESSGELWHRYCKFGCEGSPLARR